ncbi:MAG: hypothetical protein LUE09_08380 [Synergistaceae bacterium]|nr:hypothetical protein [Synergistaceae bacterium]
MRSGKHVICEKPLTGYFVGTDEDERPIGDMVPKAKMYAAVLRELEELEKVISASGRRFMYAENYIYSPNLLKAAELISAKKSRILLMRGEESLRGSSSPVSSRRTLGQNRRRLPHQGRHASALWAALA